MLRSATSKLFQDLANETKEVRDKIHNCLIMIRNLGEVIKFGVKQTLTPMQKGRRIAKYHFGKLIPIVDVDETDTYKFPKHLLNKFV